jgi:CHAD domain-containing protein
VAHKADAAACHRLRVTLKRLRYALEFFAPLFPGQRMQAYHLAATQLQDLLGQMNDLVVAIQFTKEALPARKAEFIGHWLEEKNGLLQQQLKHSLADFLKQKAPWKHR